MFWKQRCFFRLPTPENPPAKQPSRCTIQIQVCWLRPIWTYESEWESSPNMGENLKTNETTKLYGGLTFVAQGCWGKVGRSGLQPHLQFEGSIFRLSVFPTVFWKIPRPTDLNALRNKGFPYKGWSSHWLLMMPNSPKNHPLHKTPNMTHYTLSATKIYFLRSKYW